MQKVAALDACGVWPHSATCLWLAVLHALPVALHSDATCGGRI